MSDLIRRLQAAMPAGIKPKFTTPEEWLAWQREQGRKDSERIAELNRISRLQKILGRSGIQELHRECTFQNYNADLPAQRTHWIRRSGTRMRFGGFIFSGGCGTGKNHLAAAIGNHLLSKNKSVLVVTVPT